MTFWPARIGESVATGDAGLSSAMEAKPMLEIALQYADRGWRIIPCRPDKISRIQNWQVAASCDPKTIITWWTPWPNAWIALVCGCSFVVIDVDTGEAHNKVDGLAARSITVSRSR